MAPGLETSILWATGRLLRRGVASGEQEFVGVLKIHKSPEAQTAIYQAWISACQKQCLKYEESGDSGKAREYSDAVQHVLQLATDQIGASAAEKLSQAQQPSQLGTMGSGGVPASSRIAASKDMPCASHSKRPYDNIAEDASVHSCAVSQPDKRAKSEHPSDGGATAGVEPAQGLLANQSSIPVDSVTATPAPVNTAEARSMLVPPQPLQSVEHKVVASTVSAAHQDDHSQLSQRSANVRDTQHSAQSAQVDPHPISGPPSAMYASVTDPATMDHTAMQRAGHGEPAPTPLAHTSTHSIPKADHQAPSTGTNAALPRISSSQGHTRHGSTMSGDGGMKTRDGTERSASMQTARQGKSTRAPLQEMPRAEPRQQKVVTFQEPQTSRDVADSSHRQQLQSAQRASPATSRGAVKQHSNSDAPPKESCFSGWDIADPTLVRPPNYRPIRSPKEGDILFVKEAPFKIMYKIGSGASSKVYKVLGPNLRLFALKVVTLKGNSKEMVRGFQQEFDKLRSLKDSPGVINVYSIEEFPEDKLLLMCLELGDVDLAHLLRKKRQEWAARGVTDPFVADPNFIAGLWHQMLSAVKSIHEHKMVHADLKPANLVIVSGSIKIIDFGISVRCGHNTTAIHRDDNTGTVNYMSPEAISNDERVGRNSDVWSLGCILYEIAYGKLPFGHITNLASKIEAIMKGKVIFPAISQGDVLSVLKRCLVRNPDKRADIAELLNHQYLNATAGGVVTHQAMFNMMTTYSKRLGFCEDDVNEHCRQLQQAWNSGQNLSSEAVYEKAMQDRKAPHPQLEAPVVQPKAEQTVLQQQQTNTMYSSRADSQQPKEETKQEAQTIFPAKRATQVTVAKPPQHGVENAGDVLDARLMAIRRAHQDADDGNSRTGM